MPRRQKEDMYYYYLFIYWLSLSNMIRKHDFANLSVEESCMSVYALCEIDMWPHILWGPHVNLDSLNIFSYSWHGSYGKYSQFFSYHFQPSQSQQLQCLFSLLRYMNSFGMNIKGLSEMLEYWPLLTLIISRIWVQWKLKKC